jgi:hypothetical protein
VRIIVPVVGAAAALALAPHLALAAPIGSGAALKTAVDAVGSVESAQYYGYGYYRPYRRWGYYRPYRYWGYRPYRYWGYHRPYRYYGYRPYRRGYY